jgi:hypothetical protein
VRHSISFFHTLILTIQEAEIRRMAAQSQPRLSCLEKTHPQKRAGEVAQGIGPEFKLQYHKKRKNVYQCLILPQSQRFGSDASLLT